MSFNVLLIPEDPVKKVTICRSRRVAECSISPVRAGINSPVKQLRTMTGFAYDAGRTSNDWKSASEPGPRIEDE